MLNEKWIPVFENEALAIKVVQMQPEEAQKVLAENGYDFTMDEILEAGKELYKIQAQESSDELSEDELGDVAGGAGKWWKNLKVIFRDCVLPNIGGW